MIKTRIQQTTKRRDITTVYLEIYDDVTGSIKSRSSISGKTDIELKEKMKASIEKYKEKSIKRKDTKSKVEQLLIEIEAEDA